MGEKIFKYQLQETDIQTIELPKGAEILTVQVQKGYLCLWAKVDHELIAKEERHIEIIGTGNLIDDTVQRKYISTLQMLQGALVWHIFEVLEK